MRCAIALVFGVVAVAFSASAQAEGQISSPKDVPYAARVRLVGSTYGEEERYCGAVRLNTNWFLTAAECLDNKTYDSLELSYASLRADGGVGGVLTHMINIKSSQPHIHPKYTKNTNANNIGLLHCSSECEDVADQMKLFPVLPKKAEESEEFPTAKPIVSSLTVTNKTADGYDVNEVISHQTTMFDTFKCRFAYLFRPLTPEHICTATWGKEHITKVGVPLVVREEDNSKVKLIGIAASILPKKTEKNMPTVFTSISEHSEWLHRTTGLPIDG